MGRSPGFGSNTFDFIRPVQTRFRCGSTPEVLNLAKYIHSPDHSTKGTWSSIEFHSPPGVLFTFPSQYFFSIGHRVVFRLGGWSPRVPTGFHVSGGTLDTDGCFDFSPTGFSPSPIDLPMFPRSLATTYGISVDFSSSPYLDVSVQAVPLIYLWIQYMMTRLSSCRIAPFGNLRI